MLEMGDEKEKIASKADFSKSGRRTTSRGNENSCLHNLLSFRSLANYAVGSSGTTYYKQQQAERSANIDE